MRLLAHRNAASPCLQPALVYLRPHLHILVSSAAVAAGQFLSFFFN